MTGVYFRHGKHLALYRRISDLQAYWDDYWQQSDVAAILESSRAGNLGEFEQPFFRYLPKSGTILEAGCGTGKWVCALRACGYDIEGIDYAAETVERVKRIDPGLRIRQGNIYGIDRPDDYYAAYISIGVLEHGFFGQRAALTEAFRVLRPGGVALIAVPYLNLPRRRLWKRVTEAQAQELPGDLHFYQDHLHIGRFSNDTSEGRVLSCRAVSLFVFGGLIRDWAIGRWLHKQHFFFWRLRKLVLKACQRAPRWLRSDFSHMMLFVNEKTKSGSQSILEKER